MAMGRGERELGWLVHDEFLNNESVPRPFSVDSKEPPQCHCGPAVSFSAQVRFEQIWNPFVLTVISRIPTAQRGFGSCCCMRQQWKGDKGHFPETLIPTLASVHRHSSLATPSPCPVCPQGRLQGCGPCGEPGGVMLFLQGLCSSSCGLVTLVLTFMLPCSASSSW